MLHLYLQMLMDLLLNPGDTILCEEYCYPHMIESLVMPKGYVVQPVTIDRQGICPRALRKLLKEGKTRGKTRPRVLYTVPVGQNPTGKRTTSQLLLSGCTTWCLLFPQCKATCHVSSRGTDMALFSKFKCGTLGVGNSIAICLRPASE